MKGYKTDNLHVGADGRVGMVLSLPCAPWQFFLTGTTSLYVVYKLKGW
jgi:hypothetical protein